MKPSIMTTIERFTNPFTEESCDLFSLVMKAVGLMPEKIKSGLCTESISGDGEQLFEEFVANRISSAKVSKK